MLSRCWPGAIVSGAALLAALLLGPFDRPFFAGELTTCSPKATGTCSDLVVTFSHNHYPDAYDETLTFDLESALEYGSQTCSSASITPGASQSFVFKQGSGIRGKITATSNRKVFGSYMTLSASFDVDYCLFEGSSLTVTSTSAPSYKVTLSCEVEKQPSYNSNSGLILCTIGGEAFAPIKIDAAQTRSQTQCLNKEDENRFLCPPFTQALTDAQRELQRVTVSQSLLVFANPLEPVDTSRAPRLNGAPAAIWIMDFLGSIFIVNNHHRLLMNHASLTGFSDIVAAAGEISVSVGKIRSMNSCSKVYPNSALASAISSLRQQGYDANFTTPSCSSGNLVNFLPNVYL